MEFHILPIFALLCLVLRSHASSPPPPEVHWQSMLPYTSMPTALQQLLPLADAGNHPTSDTSTLSSTNIIKTGYSLASDIIKTGYSKASEAVKTGYSKAIRSDIIKTGYSKASESDIIKTGYSTASDVVKTGYSKSSRTDIIKTGYSKASRAHIIKTGYSTARDVVKTGYSKASKSDIIKTGYSTASDIVKTGYNKASEVVKTGYREASREFDENDAILNETIFFLYNDLHAGVRMRLRFCTDDSGYRARFLPHQVADSIPFSSDKLEEILSQLSVKPETVQAETIKRAIQDCEVPNVKGEERYCATSLESLVDFVVAKLGNRVKVLSSEVETGSGNKEQEYTILQGIKMIANKQVICHKEVYAYAYALFICHEISPSKAYMVPLMGSDGHQVQAVAICHMDSSSWNPEHYAFKELNVKPGPAICHFLNLDTLVWIPN